MTQDAGTGGAAALERLRTNIPGLDEVLRGGLVHGDLYLTEGQPGTGKTTFGNHLAYNHARTGGIALFVTTLAESHARMVAHLAGFQFFDPQQLARGVYYISIYDQLRDGGLSGVLGQLRRLVSQYRATLLVVDGAGLFELFATSGPELIQFTADLHSQIAVLGCTTLLLSDTDSRRVTPLATHVDGIIVLQDENVGLRRIRLLEVLKLRGVEHLRGRHQFNITPAGIEVYPRVEAQLRSSPSVVLEPRERLPLGIEGLDAMLLGGLLRRSTTLLLGAPGAGKTTTGLHFVVEGARRGEPGLIATFHESPQRLIATGDALGLDLGGHVREGRVRIVWHPPMEILLDAWTVELLQAVSEHRAQRMFLDAVTDVEHIALVPDRLYAYLVALTTELRAREITTVFSAETRSIIGGLPEMPLPAISATVDNTILLRYVELRSQLHRLISIVKVRESDYDTSIREFVISERGVAVADTFESAEAVLTGIARAVRWAEPLGSGRRRRPTGER